MQITLIPVRMTGALAVDRQGDVLTINGTAYDFSPLPEGAVLPRAAVACDWLASDVLRLGGQLQLSLILPHGPDAPAATRFPAPLTLTADGPVDLPGADEVIA